ncbi:MULTISPECIES: hypothetical protein [unclassified Streptomyces]|uniref:hypothetical protein n=1 Tax=unclassified Streptomyces TaxID=2593676 RepID=UPI003817D893
MTDLSRMLFETLLRWLIPGRGQHRALNGPTTGTRWRVEVPPGRRRLVCVRRVPPALLVMCSADSRLVRPYVLSDDEWRELRARHVRREELTENVRRLNRWSSGGGGRRQDLS